MLNTDVFCICFGLPKVQQVDLDVQGTLDIPFYRILRRQETDDKSKAEKPSAKV